jgi:hypothetical protein
MGTFVDTSDFTTGEILISQSSDSEQDLEAYIDTQELEVLQELFGLDLYNLFIADLDVNNNPQDARFIAVFDAFYDDSDVVAGWCCGARRSEGIKKMLMRFIYFEFTRNQEFIATSTGTVTSQRDNARTAKGPEYGLTTKYNIGVESYRAIARKMILDSATYPEYKGISKGKTISV